MAKFWGLVNSLNAGTMLAAIAAIFLFNFSLGLVVSETPAFQTIASFLTGLNLPVLIILAISATILVGISGGPGGVVICAMLVANTLVPQFGADAAACHRIIVAATAILDTLPLWRWLCDDHGHDQHQDEGGLSTHFPYDHPLHGDWPGDCHRIVAMVPGAGLILKQGSKEHCSATGEATEKYRL